MKRGFELLQTRKLSDLLNFQTIEKKLSFAIPTHYKLFVKTFDVGEGKLRTENFYHPKDNDYFECSFIQTEKDNDKIMFTGFFDLDKSIELFKDTYTYDPIIVKKKLLPIGGTASSKTIFLGTQKSEADLIFIDKDTDGEFDKIAINIFEFVQSLIEVPVDEDLMRRDVKHSDLYKVWGENFWRIKNDII